MYLKTIEELHLLPSDLGILDFLPLKKNPTSHLQLGRDWESDLERASKMQYTLHGPPEEAMLGGVLTAAQTAQAGLVRHSLGACWGSNPIFYTSVLTTCSLTEGGFFLPSSRKITHRAFLLITAVLLPGSQNHYRSCNICHSWYTFPRQSEPQLALCCRAHHMFQYTAVLFQLHPREKKKVIDSFRRYLSSFYSCAGVLSNTLIRKIWPCIVMMFGIFLVNFQVADLHTSRKIQRMLHTGTFGM